MRPVLHHEQTLFRLCVSPQGKWKMKNGKLLFRLSIIWSHNKLNHIGNTQPKFIRKVLQYDPVSLITAREGGGRARIIYVYCGETIVRDTIKSISSLFFAPYDRNFRRVEFLILSPCVMRKSIVLLIPFGRTFTATIKHIGFHRKANNMWFYTRSNRDERKTFLQNGGHHYNMY